MALDKLNRSPAQRAANIFDEELCSLITAAARHAHNLKRGEECKVAWEHVGNSLLRLRPYVREMMHADDLIGTD